jgi:DNA polymerase/3'-5' exonuclease PolX
MSQQTATRRTLPEAVAAADAVRDLIPRDAWAKWEVAGSVRRGRRFVGDIDHVIMPRFVHAPIRGQLFSDDTQLQNAVWLAVDELLEAGVIEKARYGESQRACWGEKHRGLVHDGWVNELYLADDKNWGAQLAIRTGPQGFSQRIMDSINSARVYVQRDGYLRRRYSGVVIPAPTERDYLRLAGMKWVDPEDRR